MAPSCQPVAIVIIVAVAILPFAQHSAAAGNGTMCHTCGDRRPPQQQQEQTRSPSQQPLQQASLPESTILLEQRPAARKSRLLTLREIAEENDWKNGMVLWPLPAPLVASMPRIVRSWVRNYMMCLGLFVGLAAVWAYYIYICFGAALFRDRMKPSAAQMREQVQVWCSAIPVYALMPAGIEWAAEQGWTWAYSRVADVGLGWHLLYFALFMASVEAGVWVMHRSLHSFGLYRSLHHVHHQYTKASELSPFAGLAFHPLDGIMQALPYCWTMLFVPMHFMTFELLLLATGLWTTNIHDAVDGRVPPLLGAGYHTVHHEKFKYNYGHYTTYMDALCGTLLAPEDVPALERKQARELSS